MSILDSYKVGRCLVRTAAYGHKERSDGEAIIGARVAGGSFRGVGSEKMTRTSQASCGNITGGNLVNSARR